VLDIDMGQLSDRGIELEAPSRYSATMLESLSLCIEQLVSLLMPSGRTMPAPHTAIVPAVVH